MSVINITKISGVVIVTQTTGSPRSYFGVRGSYVPSSDGLSISIQVGNDNLLVALSDLQVNGQSPATLSTALVLLNSIFGT